MDRLRSPYVWGYAGILLVASLLRFWHISDKGLFTYDDARLMHFVNTLHSLFYTGVLPLQPEFFSSAKPGAIFPFVGAVLMFSPQDSLFGFFTAFWGVVVVAMTMVITRKLTRNSAAVICAGILSALSPLQVHYSRSFNIAGSLTMLFVLLILYLYLRYREKRTSGNAVLLGGAMGYAFTVNYSLLPYIALFALLFLIEEIRRKDKFPIHLAGFSLATLAAPVVFELSYRLLKLSDGRFFTYLAMLKAHRAGIGMDQQIYFDPLYYVSLLAKYDGVTFVLAICGIYFAYRNFKTKREILPLIPGIAVAIMCLALSAGTAYMVSVPRTSYSVIPLLPVLAGVAVASVSVMLAEAWNDREKNNKVLIGATVAALAGVALFWNAMRVGEVESLQSGYQRAAAWVNNKGGKAGCYVHCMIYETYSRNFVSQMNKSVDANSDYLVVDFADRMLLGKQDFYGWGKYAADRAHIDSLDRSQEPLAVFRNSIGISELFTLEMGGGRTGTRAGANPLNGQIRIYSYPN